MTAVITIRKRRYNGPTQTFSVEVCSRDAIRCWFRDGYIMHEHSYYPMSSVENIQVYA